MRKMQDMKYYGLAYTLIQTQCLYNGGLLCKVQKENLCYTFAKLYHYSPSRTTSFCHFYVKSPPFCWGTDNVAESGRRTEMADTM